MSKFVGFFQITTFLSKSTSLSFSVLSCEVCVWETALRLHRYFEAPPPWAVLRPGHQTLLQGFRTQRGVCLSGGSFRASIGLCHQLPFPDFSADLLCAFARQGAEMGQEKENPELILGAVFFFPFGGVWPSLCSGYTGSVATT